jgi:hypothetical protein
MPRKQGRERLDDAAKRARNIDPEDYARRLEYAFFNALGIIAFIVVALILAGAAATGRPAIAAVAGIILFIWVAATLRPRLEIIENAAEWLWSDDSADRLHNLWCRIIPWRDKRGTTTPTGVAAVALAVLVTASLFAFAIPATATTPAPENTQAAAEECSTTVEHDWPLRNATAEEYNNSSKVSDVVQNTKVTIEHTDGFYRVDAENPNGYCVNFIVRIHRDIIPPTELGTVSSVNDTTTAEWHDITDFESQDAYTEIEFSLGGGEQAMFAPSAPAVVVPAWRDERKREAKGVLAEIASLIDIESPFDDDTENLKTKEYTFSKPNDTDYVTVRLENESTGQSIDDWYAVEREEDSSEPWNPVTQDSSSAVFYRIVDDGTKLQFTFNDPNTTVRFTANPEATDTFSYELESLQRSFYELRESFSLPFTIGFAIPALTWRPQP